MVVWEISGTGDLPAISTAINAHFRRPGARKAVRLGARLSAGPPQLE
jgi:hypothetical protein